MSDLPEAVAAATTSWLHEANAALPGFVTAFYVTGSAALGAFDPRHSDIDFVAVAAHGLNPAQRAALEHAHRRVQRRLGHGLDGLLVTETALRGESDEPLPTLRHGRIVGMCPWRACSLDAHVLREYGVVVRGLPPAALMPPVGWDSLCPQMVENLNDYWRRWHRDSARLWSPKGIGLLWNAQVEWGVLGVSRIAYSLREHAVISKAGAGQYMLNIAPPKWHAILQEALRPRLGGPARFASPFVRRQAALAYIDWMINWANESKCLQEKADKRKPSHTEPWRQ